MSNRGSAALADPDRRGHRHRVAARSATVDAIASVQLPDGNIPWFPGGHTDPWNQSRRPWRSTSGGRHAEAERAVRVAAPASSTTTASWHAYYLGDDVEGPTLDTNVTCYVATGVWHHYLVTGDTGFLGACGRRSRRAIDFALDYQHRDRRDRVGAGRRIPATARCSPARRASTISLRCAIADRRAPRPRAPRLGAVARLARHRHRAPPRARSSTRTAGRWTGTTRSSAACCAATPANARIAARWDDVRRRRAAACAACRTSRGSPRPRRASS